MNWHTDTKSFGSRGGGINDQSMDGQMNCITYTEWDERQLEQEEHCNNWLTFNGKCIWTGNKKSKVKAQKSMMMLGERERGRKEV